MSVVVGVPGWFGVVFVRGTIVLHLYCIITNGRRRRCGVLKVV